MSLGKSVRLFLVDGTPGGLVTAEIMNWTGHAVAAPRSELSELLKREETKRTGIYILLGDDPEGSGRPVAYIGEGDVVRTRLYQHARTEEHNGKDFWDRAVVLTSKDANLTKAHARYLESRLIALAQKVNRAELTNSTAPDLIQLPEADASDMEFFIEQARIVLPVLGVNLLRSAAATPTPLQPSMAPARMDSPLFKLRMRRDNITATAREVDGEFMVLEGAQARLTWVGVDRGAYGSHRERLEQDGTLARSSDGKSMYFTRNHAFTSPSAAAAVVLGRTANGRTEWSMQDGGMTYGDWQQQGLDEAMDR